MSFFDDALNDLDTLEEDILGPDYNYSAQIKTPDQLGVSTSGDAFTDNIAALDAYGDVLAFGGGKASKTKGAMGDKFFMETGATCNDVATGNQVTRSIFINNIPDGSIPFLPDIKASSMEGLVPGILSSVGNINPLKIFQAFMTGANPDCQAVTLDVVDASNNKTSETKYVINSDISDMDACLWGKKGKNPVTGSKCESFQNKTANMPDDPVVKFYLCTLGLLGFYIFLNTYAKAKKI